MVRTFTTRRILSEMSDGHPRSRCIEGVHGSRPMSGRALGGCMTNLPDWCREEDIRARAAFRPLELVVDGPRRLRAERPAQTVDGLLDPAGHWPEARRRV